MEAGAPLTVDGAPRTAEDVQIVRRFRVTIDGREYDVEIDDPSARPVIARVSGEVFRVQVSVQDGAGARAPAQPEPTAAPAPTASSSNAAAALRSPNGDHALMAPMPGTILSLMATVGQAVQRGDELLTIEAMKMFNVIRAPWSGRVAQVHVTEGKVVSHGDLLVTLASS